VWYRCKLRVSQRAAPPCSKMASAQSLGDSACEAERATPSQGCGRPKTCRCSASDVGPSSNGHQRRLPSNQHSKLSNPRRLPAGMRGHWRGHTCFRANFSLPPEGRPTAHATRKIQNVAAGEPFGANSALHRAGSARLDEAPLRRSQPTGPEPHGDISLVNDYRGASRVTASRKLAQ
jgi:hypothetical protein